MAPLQIVGKDGHIGPKRRGADVFDYLFGAAPDRVEGTDGLIQRLIDFANGETDTSICRWPLATQEEWLYPSPSDAPHDRDLDEQRILVRDLLAAAVSMKGTGEPGELYGHIDAHLLDGIILVMVLGMERPLHRDVRRARRDVRMLRHPALFGTGGRLQWDLRINKDAPGTDFDKVLGFAANLLFWDHDRSRSDLCRCEWEPCQRFFRVVREGRGKPRTKYCCDEHMLLAHQKDSPRRRREAKEKRLAEAKKPRRRRSS